VSPLPDITASDGDPVLARDMVHALTARELIYEDGSTQTFASSGGTTFVEGGRPSDGEWGVVDDGRFSSFWPPTYRATYYLRWIVEDGQAVGLNFTGPGGEHFSGRYR
jgi:hypothetical protein